VVNCEILILVINMRILAGIMTAILIAFVVGGFLGLWVFLSPDPEHKTEVENGNQQGKGNQKNQKY